MNYLSALGWPQRKYSLWWLAKEHEIGGAGGARADEFADLDGQGRPGAAWAGTAQAQCTNAFHLIGKDISRFHCILWPALLIAAGVPLPRQVYVHGFIYARGGGKMSKSLGNTADPIELAEKFGADALRLYLLRSFETGKDGEFTVEQFVEYVNTALANELGNLASRTLSMVHKYFEGQRPSEWEPDSLLGAGAREALDALMAAADVAAVEVPKAFDELRVNEALNAAWAPVVLANALVDRVKPWVVAKEPARRAELATAMNALLETLRLVAIWTWPAIPAKSEALWSQLRLAGRPGDPRGEGALPAYGRAPLGEATLAPVEILFPRIELEAKT
jgi:methionyl-tRNA synthetase